MNFNLCQMLSVSVSGIYSSEISLLFYLLLSFVYLWFIGSKLNMDGYMGFNHPPLLQKRLTFFHM